MDSKDISHAIHTHTQKLFPRVLHNYYFVWVAGVYVLLHSNRSFSNVSDSNDDNKIDKYKYIALDFL